RTPHRTRPRTPSWCAGPREVVRGAQALARATSLARPDLRFAAWFWWMTPLETALSSLRDAVFSASSAAAASPVETAARTLRTCVLSSDFTARLRRRAFSLVLFRLIWDLMFATKTLLLCCCGGSPGTAEGRSRRGRRWGFAWRRRVRVAAVGTRPGSTSLLH